MFVYERPVVWPADFKVTIRLSISSPGAVSMATNGVGTVEGTNLRSSTAIRSKTGTHSMNFCRRFQSDANAPPASAWVAQVEFKVEGPRRARGKARDGALILPEQDRDFIE